LTISRGESFSRSAIFSFAISEDPTKNIAMERPAKVQASKPVFGVVFGIEEAVAFDEAVAIGVEVGLAFGVGVRVTRGVAVGATVAWALLHTQEETAGHASKRHTPT
jgi:hypothetical protein